MKLKPLFPVITLTAAPLLFLFSCLAPSDDVKTELYSSFMEKVLHELKREDKTPEEKKQFMEDYKVIISIPEGSETVLQSYRSSKYPKAILSSNNNNGLITNFPLYVTGEKNKLQLSLDGINWFALKEEDGIKNKFDFDTVISENSFLIKYSMDFIPTDQFTTHKIRKKKEIIPLENGMIFIHDDKTKVNTDLEETIILVPENTVLNLDISVDGNLIKSSREGNQSKMTALRDIFIYINNKSFAISFDNKTWISEILGFEVSAFSLTQSISDNEIIISFDLSAVYDKENQSLSLLKLFVTN